MLKIFSIIDRYAIILAHPYAPILYINAVCDRVDCQLILVINPFRYGSYREVGGAVDYNYVCPIDPGVYAIG